MKLQRFFVNIVVIRVFGVIDMSEEERKKKHYIKSISMMLLKLTSEQLADIEYVADYLESGGTFKEMLLQQTEKYGD